MSNLNLNKVILGGRLTATPELKQTQSGVMVAQFTVAISRRASKDGAAPVADFISCVAWREKAEFLCRYFRKGSSICVVGAIQTRTWTDKQGTKRYATDVVADEISFVDSKGEGTPHPSAAPPPSPTGEGSPPPSYYTPEGGNMPAFEEITGDDELPF